MTGRVHRDRPEHLRVQGRESPPARRIDPAAAQVLRLQQAAGNRAVGRVLARRAVRQTGLRDEQAIDRFVHKATSFADRNGDAELRIFANYLAAAVNEELAAIGVPAVKINMTDPVDSSAVFDGTSWTMTLNPAMFSRRTAVRLIADLTTDEAAEIAGTVYHEARHAEQRFRVARRDVAEHGTPGHALQADTAAAAAASPLRGGGREVEEAKEWRDNESSGYRVGVNQWLSDITALLPALHGVNAQSAPAVREQVGQQLKDWGKPGGLVHRFRDHLAAARRRHKATVSVDIQVILNSYDDAVFVHAGLPEGADPAEFENVTAAITALRTVLYVAYSHQPVESDGLATESAASEAYQKVATGH